MVEQFNINANAVEDGSSRSIDALAVLAQSESSVSIIPPATLPAGVTYELKVEKP
jgi:hypothetical protein